MSDTLYYVLSALLSLMVLMGIRWMSRVETAAYGNRLSALAMLIAVAVVLLKEGIIGQLELWIGLLLGGGVGLMLAVRVRMISMPQLVGLLNGLGGLASAIAALLSLMTRADLSGFERVTALLALSVGGLTFSGSLVAAGKLHRLLPQKPIVLRAHRLITLAAAMSMLLFLVLALALPGQGAGLAWGLLALSLSFGLLFALPVGGADMPITISLLNATSGLAAAIAGMAIGDVLLVSVGGIVGASGLLLTQIMCRAMNRSLSAILFARGAGALPVEAPPQAAEAVAEEAATEPAEAPGEEVLADWFRDAKDIILIPGYGMALSQAQALVKQLDDRLSASGKRLRYAIHPVAGRMPGHMNVLLAEVDIDYERLHEMEEINPELPSADLVIVVGANDVINPAANTAEGTPIYGMPILEAGAARRLVICNYDLKPGYAGVENPLYEKQEHVLLLLGDAKDSIAKMLDALG